MRGRVATPAHPLCTCREHDHELDQCIGPQFIYRRPDGSEYALPCRILGGIEASSREACVMHKPAASRHYTHDEENP